MVENGKWFFDLKKSALVNRKLLKARGIKTVLVKHSDCWELTLLSAEPCPLCGQDHSRSFHCDDQDY